MYEKGYKQRLIGVSSIFENHFGVKPLYDYFWSDIDKSFDVV